MSITGNEGQPPARVGMSIGDIGAGLYTAVAVNAALVHRLKTGEAPRSISPCSTARSRCWKTRSCATRSRARSPARWARAIRPSRRSRPSRPPTAPSSSPPATTACSSRCARRSAGPTWPSNPDYKTNALRQKHHGRLEHEIEAVLKAHTTDALARRARQGRRAGRADQQHRAGAGPSAGRGAQHAGRGARRQRRHAEARRQSASRCRPSTIPRRDGRRRISTADRAAILSYLGG